MLSAAQVLNINECLLPCPFCKQPGLIIETTGKYDVGCKTKECFLELGANWYLDSPLDAMIKWNDRK